MQRHSFSTHVDKQKQEHDKRFSSWLFFKFKKKDRKRLSETGERHSRHSLATTGTGKHGMPKGSGSGSSPPPLQRQQSFLRQQLMEMKRQSASMLVVPKRDEDGCPEATGEGNRSPGTKKGSNQDEEMGWVLEDDEENKSANANTSEMEGKRQPDELVEGDTTALAGNQKEEVQEADTDTTTTTTASSTRKSSQSRRSLRESNQVMEESDSEEEEPPMKAFDEMDDDDQRRSVISMEAHRHLSQATQLYAEALGHLQRAHASLFSRASVVKAPASPAVQPQPEPQPKRGSKVKQPPQSEWI